MKVWVRHRFGDRYETPTQLASAERRCQSAAWSGGAVSPRWYAYDTARARSLAPILAKMWLMWLLTVASLMMSWLAISVFDLPSAMSLRTSASLGVRPSGRPGAGAVGERPATAWTRWCWTAGSIAA